MPFCHDRIYDLRHMFTLLCTKSQKITVAHVLIYMVQILLMSKTIKTKWVKS